MALVASVWAGESGGGFGVPEVIASMPLRLHGTTLQFGSRPVPSWMVCSLIFHFCFCSRVRELGISVGVCEKISGIRKSGLVRCWHVVLVYFFSQVRRVVGVSAARWVYLRVGLSLGLAWSLCADISKSAMSNLRRADLSLLLLPAVPAPVCMLDSVPSWWLYMLSVVSVLEVGSSCFIFVRSFSFVSVAPRAVPVCDVGCHSVLCRVSPSTCE